MATIILQETPTTTEQPIDLATWQKILEKTDNFKLPGVEKGMLSAQQVLDFKTSIMDVIRFICTQQTDEYGFRVYLDGKKMGSDYLKSSVYPNLPAVGDDGSTWTKDVFQENKFGIILNSSEKFSMKIADQLSALMQPLLDTLGIPSSGMHSTVFIGNYGFTPLGIHQDHYGANVIHFHLGPGEKIMYTWDASLFEGLDPADKTLEAVLPKAKEFPFGTGDLYFMPWDQYHIGRTDEISTGLTVWFDNHSNKALLETLISAVKLQFPNDQLTDITPLEKDIHQLNLSIIDKIVSGNPRATELSFKDLLKQTFSEFKLALFSNRGWRAIPMTMEEISSFKVDDHYNELNDKNIQVPFPYQLYYNVNEPEITVYARGAKITIKHHPYIEEIIAELNRNQVINTDILLEKLTTVWPKEAGLYFLAMLYNKRGFYIISDPSKP